MSRYEKKGCQRKHPSTGDKDYTADELEFMRALDAYKREKSRPFPTCCEVLEVLKGLGYRKEKGEQ